MTRGAVLVIGLVPLVWLFLVRTCYERKLGKGRREYLEFLEASRGWRRDEMGSAEQGLVFFWWVMITSIGWVILVPVSALLSFLLQQSRNVDKVNRTSRPRAYILTFMNEAF